MRQKKTFITILLVLAFLCLGIVYAEITGVSLKISGDIAATTSEGKIDVQFTSAQVTQKPDNATANASIQENDKKTATIDISGLNAENQSVTIVYTIKNLSTDVSATLAEPSIEYTNTEWFDVQCTLSGTTLAKKDTAENTDTQTATVVVKLKKTPVKSTDADAAEDTISITINANPVANAVLSGN